jgi:hypothetical protein
MTVTEKTLVRGWQIYLARRLLANFAQAGVELLLFETKEI